MSGVMRWLLICIRIDQLQPTFWGNNLANAYHTRGMHKERNALVSDQSYEYAKRGPHVVTRMDPSENIKTKN